MQKVALKQLLTLKQIRTLKKYIHHIFKWENKNCVKKKKHTDTWLYTLFSSCMLIWNLFCWLYGIYLHITETTPLKQTRNEGSPVWIIGNSFALPLTLQQQRKPLFVCCCLVGNRHTSTTARLLLCLLYILCTGVKIPCDLPGTKQQQRRHCSKQILG